MRSIRKFAYAAFLMLSALTIQPSLATAEDARGNFTLTHEVHWQKQVLPAGEYAFSLKPAGPSEILVFQSLSKPAFSAMMLVNEVGTPSPHDISRLLLVSKNGQSFVSAMELPQFDMVLRFKVPTDNAEKRMTASVALGASSAR